MAALTSLTHAGMILRMDDSLDFTPENMKRRRRELGISQTDLAQMLTPPAVQRTVVHWEQGNYKIKSPRKEQIAAILGLRIDGKEVRDPTEPNEPPVSLSAIRAEMAVTQARALLDDALEALKQS